MFRAIFLFLLVFTSLWAVREAWGQNPSTIGREVAIARHLRDGEEFTTSLRDLINYGFRLFTAQFTTQEGAGRPPT